MATVSIATSIDLQGAVGAALDEFVHVGRTKFLAKYGLHRSKSMFVRHQLDGLLCDAEAVLAVAEGIVARTSEVKCGTAGRAAEVLIALGFDVVESGRDWTEDEVARTVDDYFQMLALEARRQPYNKSARNAELRQYLRRRSKASIELKHQNISAVLMRLGLPFIDGYKPRGNVQGLLRVQVCKYVERRLDLLDRIVDDFQESTPAGKQMFKGVLTTPPIVPLTVKKENPMRARIPRRLDFAARDEANRSLGRSGEEWAVGYEAHRLVSLGLDYLAAEIDWVADRLGDGAGYDIRSLEVEGDSRFIEVKTTNGPELTPFYVSRGELEFSEEAASEYWLYRIFNFRKDPRLYILQGELHRHYELEPVDYRARLKAFT